MRLGAKAWALAGLASLALAGASGCTTSRSEDYERRRVALELTDVLREEALRLPDEGPRERLVTGLVQLREVLVGRAGLKPLEGGESGPVLPRPEGGMQPVPAWAQMFLPANLVIGYFTRSKDFDGVPGEDGIEVRVQPMDAFGDPVKAVGSYRVEVFALRRYTNEKRGVRLGHWYVSVLDAKSQRLYYDPIDRSYVFPLLWERRIAAGSMVIVQATFYPPGGFEEKLMAQRVIKIGAE